MYPTTNPLYLLPNCRCRALPRAGGGGLKLSLNQARARANSAPLGARRDETRVTEQDKPNDTFYIIKSGEVKVLNHGTTKATLSSSAKGFFGERSLLKSEP